MFAPILPSLHPPNLEDKDGVLGLFVGSCALVRLDDDIGNTVAHGRRRAGVALAHTLGQLHMRLLAGVVVLAPRQLLCGGKKFSKDEHGGKNSPPTAARQLRDRAPTDLGDDKLADVDAVAQQVADGLLGVLDRPLDVALNQELGAREIGIGSVARIGCRVRAPTRPLSPHLVQACVDERHHQATVVAAHRHNALGVHLVILLRLGPVQTGVSAGGEGGGG